MTDTAPQAWIPGPAQRCALNNALRKRGTATGFWEDGGCAAPWPDDIDEWRPFITEPVQREPGQQRL